MTMCGVVFLVLSLVVGRVAAYISTGLILTTLWLVVPLPGGHDGPLES